MAAAAAADDLLLDPTSSCKKLRSSADIGSSSSQSLHFLSFPSSCSSSSLAPAPAPPLLQVPFDYSATFAAVSAPADVVDFSNVSFAGSVTPAGTKTKLCTKFFSTSGCPYGEMCHFLHFVPGGGMAATVGGGKINNPAAAVASLDPSLTVNGYKTRLCNRFGTPEGCRYGENCHFAHGEADIRRPVPKPISATPHYPTLLAPAAAAAAPPPFAAIPVYSDTSYCAPVSSATAAFNPAYPTPPSAAASTFPTAAFCYPNPTAAAASYATTYPPSTSSQPPLLCATAYPPPVYTSSGFVNGELITQQTVMVPALISDTTGMAAAYGYGSEPTPPGVTVVAPPSIETGYEAALTA